jgi:hypothetical protein
MKSQQHGLGKIISFPKVQYITPDSAYEYIIVHRHGKKKWTTRVCMRFEVKRNVDNYQIFRNNQLVCVNWRAPISDEDVYAHILAERLTYLHCKWVRREILAFIWCWKQSRGQPLARLQRDVLLLICQRYLKRPPAVEWYSNTSWEQLDDQEKDYKNRSVSEEQDLRVFRLVFLVVVGFLFGHLTISHVLFWVLFMTGMYFKWLPDTKQMWEGFGEDQVRFTRRKLNVEGL